ncbi:hypothetical protein [Chromobacterium vaccinii]|uniref:hypothetical protein n=1 Tax=Chromobacterium vaccinii TaxID=1108595 RepID=UPI000E1ACC8C|nr:hypothetical protein [Chromobacterium vaccinii]SUX53655.1 Uncharacterised protein [Chromobacterium vaccinii]
MMSLPLFKTAIIGALAGALTASSSALAVSKLYDATASAVLKGGKPCFYTLAKISNPPPDYMKGMGMSFSVFNEATGSKGYAWNTWFASWARPLPTSPALCVPYGVASPDQNKQPAKPLPRDTPLSFAMTGEHGKHGVGFCVRKNGSGRDYLSTVTWQDGIASCTTEPLRSTP